MKQRYLFGLFACLLTFELAAQSTSNLIVFSQDGDPFYVILNGIRQNDQPQTNVRVEGLTSNYYNLTVIFENGAYPEINKKNAPVTDYDGNRAEVTYQIKSNKKGEKSLKYYSMVAMEMAPPAAPTQTVVVYNTTPKPEIGTSVSVTESYSSTTTTSSTSTTTSTTTTDDVDIDMMGINMGVEVNDTYNSDGSESVDMDVNFMGIDMGIDVDMGGGNSSSTTTTTHTYSTTTYDAGGPADPPIQTFDGCKGAWPMGSVDFNSAKNSIEK